MLLIIISLKVQYFSFLILLEKVGVDSEEKQPKGAYTSQGAEL